MEQRFIKFEEAVEKLGISGEKLNELREAGQLRAYRDGASWKFRTDEIEKLLDEGIPEPAPPSDIGLAGPDELVSDASLDDLPEIDDLGGLKLVDDDDDDNLDLDLELPAAETEPSDPSDSILLSDEELGESAEQPPSTIIGKHELPDADLELVSEDEGGDPASMSDVRLAPGASDVLSSGIVGSDVLDEMGDGHSSAFDDLDELAIDLEEEASRVHSHQAAKPQPKDADDEAADTHKAGGSSDLELADLEDSGVGSDLGMAVDPEEGTDPAPEELIASSGGSDLDLGTDDDFVLAEAGGSDITLDSADSGINLGDPSDSGVALDGIPLDIGGSAILSSLSLEGLGSDPDVSLVGDDDKGSDAPLAELQTDDDFQLTPLGEGGDEDQDSSSQVIALDGGMEDLAEGDAGILSGDPFSGVDDGDDVVLTPDYGDEGDGGLGIAGYEGGAVAVRGESEYTLMNLLGLGSAAILLLLGMILLVDIIRNLWSWNETFTLTSPLLEALCGLFGLK